MLRRPRLERRLDECLSKRLTLLVADAGFGKSTLLAAWAEGNPAVFHTFERHEQGLAPALAAIERALGLSLSRSPAPEAEEDPLLISALASAVAGQVDEEVALVLDDTHELGGGSPAARLLDALVRQAPPGLHLVLSSRSEPPFPTQRLRGQGQVLELRAAELAFDLDEVRMFLGSTMDAPSSELATSLHELTLGWPAAVRLAADALARAEAREAVIDQLRGMDGPLFPYLAEEVFGQDDRPVRELLSKVAPFAQFTSNLCEAIGLKQARQTIVELEQRGFLTRREGDTLVLHGLVRDFARECLPLAANDHADVLRRASAWLEAQHRIQEALAIAADGNDFESLARLLVEHGEELLRANEADAIIAATEALPPDARTPAIEEVLGAAFLERGERDKAASCFERAAAGLERLPARLAGLMVRAESERGRQDAALAVFRRANIDGSTKRDVALLFAWSAQPLWNAGDVDEARRLAERAVVVATDANDPYALAAAHGAVAMTLLGRAPECVDDHMRLAVAAAEEAGDAVTAVRFRLNRTHLLTPRDALPEIDAALHLAEISGAPNLAYAFHRRGEAHYYLGRLEDAALDFEHARSLNAQLGSARESWDLMYLGDIARERGDLGRAKAAYGESLRIARAGPDAQGLRGSAAGLALVLAGEDPARARELAAEAVAVGRTIGHDLPAALNAAGWVALHAGDVDAAGSFAEESEHDSRRLGFAPHLADALELAAMSGTKERQLRRLEEAGSIWAGLGNELAASRTHLAVARLTGDRGAATRLARRLRAAGVRESAAAAAGLLSCLAPETPPPVAVRTLGGFSVLRDGVPVALSEWRSRKARDLLKILISRRGRPTTRDALFEALWPGGDPAALGRRLSVALSILRGVLDPQKRYDADHFVAAEQTSVSLRRSHLAIDVDTFLADARAGLEGDRDRLAAAEEAYNGDFLEEDIYEDWSVGLREEARLAYIEVARRLAREAAVDEAIRYLLRVLERDAYDEQAHLDLVSALDRAGRRGEARRCYRAYAARMAEIDVEPSTYPGS